MKYLIPCLLYLSSNSCLINGYESGVCISLNEIRNQVPFCIDYLREYVCVPK